MANKILFDDGIYSSYFSPVNDNLVAFINSALQDDKKTLIKFKLKDLSIEDFSQECLKFFENCKYIGVKLGNAQKQLIIRRFAKMSIFGELIIMNSLCEQKNILDIDEVKSIFIRADYFDDIDSYIKKAMVSKKGDIYFYPYIINMENKFLGAFYTENE